MSKKHKTKLPQKPDTRDLAMQTEVDEKALESLVDEIAIDESLSDDNDIFPGTAPEEALPDENSIVNNILDDIALEGSQSDDIFKEESLLDPFDPDEIADAEEKLSDYIKQDDQEPDAKKGAVKSISAFFLSLFGKNGSAAEKKLKREKKELKAREAEERNDRTIRYIGYGIVLFFFLSVIALSITVSITKFVPGLYIALATIALLLLAGLFAVLQEWFIPGMAAKLLAVFLGVIFVVGSVYAAKTYLALKAMTGLEFQTANIEVYTIKGNYYDISDTKGLKYGILTDTDRDNTERALAELRNNVSFTTVEYDTVRDLINGLKSGEVQAIVLNSAFFAIAQGMEGFESISEELFSLKAVQIVTRVAAGEDPTLPPMQPTASPTAPSDPTLPPDLTPDPDITPTVTPTPYTGLAYNFDGMTVDKAYYMYGNNNVFTAYLSGIDVYGSPDYIRNSDVNILIVVNMNTHKILMLNTPRDYYVMLSGANMRDKLTHAGCYGIKTSMSTLQALYGVNIDYYAKINFTGFVNVIDNLGGVDVYSDYDFLEFHKGLNHLNGVGALTFSRERYSFIDGDRQRGKNQMAVINAIIKKLLSTEALVNFDALLNSVSGCVATNMEYARMTELVRYQLSYGGDWEITTYSVNGSDGWDLCYALGAANYVMIPDMSTVEKARNLIRSMYGY